VTSTTYADLLKNRLRPASSPNVVDVWVQVVCFNATMLGRILPIQLLQQTKTVLWVSSTSAILARPRLQWLSCLWTTQRGDGMQAFQVRRRGAAGSARTAALSTKRIFLEVCLHFRSAVTLVRNEMETK
jgi:hypothetical protein